jgi:hypothetical protein
VKKRKKLPRRVEEVVRTHVPLAVLMKPKAIMASIVGARDCGMITAEVAESALRELTPLVEKGENYADMIMELKYIALLQYYRIPEDSPGGGWHSAAAGWKLASKLAHDYVPGFGYTDAPIKPAGAPSKERNDDLKLVKAVEAARARKPGTSFEQAFAAVARMPEYKNRAARTNSWKWVKAAYYRAKQRSSPMLSDLAEYLKDK